MNMPHRVVIYINIYPGFHPQLPLEHRKQSYQSTAELALLYTNTCAYMSKNAQSHIFVGGKWKEKKRLNASGRGLHSHLSPENQALFLPSLFSSL